MQPGSSFFHSNGRNANFSLALYDDPHSEYSAKVKIALRAKGLSWTPLAVPCGSMRSPEFLAINPLGKIPVLLATGPDGERQAICESEVIVEFLEDAFPQPFHLLPSDPFERSKARLLSRFHDLYLEPALRRLYPQVALSVRDDAVVQEAAAAFRARLSELESLLPEPEPNRKHGTPSSSTANYHTTSNDLTANGPTANGLTVGHLGYPALFLYAELILPVLLPYGSYGLITDSNGHQPQLQPPVSPLPVSAGATADDEEGQRPQPPPLCHQPPPLAQPSPLYDGLYDGLPRVRALRCALWADPAVAGVLAELRPAAQEWLEKKLKS